MQHLNKLLDNAAVLCSPPNDTGIANHLKVTRSTVSGWRNAKNGMRDKHLIVLASLAKADPQEVLFVKEELATSKAERALWRALLDRLSPAVATVGMFLLCAMPFPGNAHAKAILSAGLPTNVYYVK